ncbi:MAG: M28 family peptidase [Planctomycetales bacterium]|nr:M28 family peptidase [Planctomycetales bacterium]
MTCLANLSPYGSPICAQTIVEMPGESYQGPLPELTKSQLDLAAELRWHVDALAAKVGERNLVRRPARLIQAANYVDKCFRAVGLEPKRQTYRVGRGECDNLECEFPGGALAEEIVVVGAHYDSVSGCPGANDNGSGAAALLSLARLLRDAGCNRTIRLVAFANEEQPYFQTGSMGSYVYARRCQSRGETITAMISLETIGYYSDRPGSQRYPAPLSRYYPTTGNFVAFVGDTRNAPLVKQCVAAFRQSAKFPSEGGALPRHLAGVGWSDHWSFWQHGYPAVMVTDTALFRYPHYHRASDTPDKIDYERMALVVEGLAAVIHDLSGAAER